MVIVWSMSLLIYHSLFTLVLSLSELVNSSMSPDIYIAIYTLIYYTITIIELTNTTTSTSVYIILLTL